MLARLPRGASVSRRFAGSSRAAHAPQCVAVASQPDAPGSSDGTQRFALRVPLDVSDGRAPRLDAYVAAALLGTSRGRVAAAIRAGALSVNGRTCTKPAQVVRAGDALLLALAPPPPLEAVPEALPLAVVYEDEHVLVVNKAAHMVVHPSAGHARGTLVNAVLHHCGLPAMRVAAGSAAPTVLLSDDAEAEAEEEEEGQLLPAAPGPPGVLRPGIVHRLDKGTSGLLVVAKSAAAHASLCAQFAARSVRRRYEALHLVAGSALPPAAGRVEAPIGRDPHERLRQAVVWAPGGGRAAASRYSRVETLAGGAACRLEWRLETGRTHQIRVHAKHLLLPLVNDALYGGGGGAAVAALGRGGRGEAASALLASLPEGRPMLHAVELGFEHPATGAAMNWTAEPPADFAEALAALRAF